MDLLVLIFWLLTVMGGLYMFGLTTRSGNTHSGATKSHLPSAVVFSHGALALAGLAVWAIYMTTDDEDALAWGAFATLLVVAALGTHMFLRWHKDRKGSEAEVARRREQLAEQQIPSAVVHFHGATAGATIVLVLLTALGVTLSR